MAWSHHAKLYQRQLVIFPAMALLFSAMIWPVTETVDEFQYMLMVYGEVLSPTLAGWVAAGLLLGDPCRELLFIAPSPIWQSVLKRFFLLIYSASLTWALLLLILSYLIVPVSFTLLIKMFIGGFITNLLFAGIGLWATLPARSLITGRLIIGLMLTSNLIFRTWLPRHVIGQFIYPFLTMEDLNAPVWRFNKLVLGVVSLLLILFSIRLMGEEEPFLPKEIAEGIN